MTLNILKFSFISMVFACGLLFFSQDAVCQEHKGMFLMATDETEIGTLSFLDEAGATVGMNDFAGKPVIVNLWATWCAPCVAELPALSRLAAMEANEFKIVAISMDRNATPEKLRNFLTENGADSLGVYQDQGRSVWDAVNPGGLPLSLVFNSKGELLSWVKGEVEWDSPKVLEFLDDLIDEEEQK